jgi:hypothetical protein
MFDFIKSILPESSRETAHMKKIYLVLVFLIVSTHAAAAGKTKLDRLISADMIGLQRAYFEKIAGVAKRVSDRRRQYDIRGCLVTIVEDKDKTILSIELENISERCTFNAATIFLEGPAHKLTFGRLNDVNIGGGAKESCLGLCGNAAAPSYGLMVQTPHAMTFIEYDAEVSNSDTAWDAAERLRSQIEARFPGVELYGDYVGKTIPAKVFTEMWLKEFRHVRITSIRIGYNIF